MSLLLYILVFTLLGGLLSVIAASVFLLLPEQRRTALLPYGISFAIGSLLSVAFIGLLPEALERIGMADSPRLFLVVLVALLVFFILEKMLLWRHCHASDCEQHAYADARLHQPAGTLILFGDGIHNFVDGILIAAAFMTDIKLGIITSVAVAAHEIPQEVGDFAILLHSGYTRGRAFFWNAVSSLTTIVGGLLTYYALNDIQGLLPYILAIAAASFIYIAVADLIPNLHRHVEIRASIMQLVMIGIGVLLIYMVHDLAHPHDSVGHQHAWEAPLKNQQPGRWGYMHAVSVTYHRDQQDDEEHDQAQR